MSSSVLLMMGLKSTVNVNMHRKKSFNEGKITRILVLSLIRKIYISLNFTYTQTHLFSKFMKLFYVVINDLVKNI